MLHINIILVGHVEHHRLFRQEFNTAEAMAFHRIYELQAARRLLRRLLNTSDHEEELRLYVKSYIR